MVLYCVADKRRIVKEAAAHGATKKGIARRYQICSSQIRRWTKEIQNCTLEMLEERGKKKTLHLGPDRIHAGESLDGCCNDGKVDSADLGPLGE